jgi:acetyl esterase/lipase/DNA-binding GntR family transcriptional regulator
MDARTRSLDVYAWLKQQIILSRYAPGQAVAELDVATQMGCSQGTVREAMLRLQEEGLIVRNGYRGTTVTPVSATEGPLVLKLRAQLETEALRLSLPKVTPEHIETLRGLVREMEAMARSGDEYALFEIDQRFHVTLFQIAELPSLVPVLVRCSLYNHRNKIALEDAPRSLMETAQRHWAIVKALESGSLTEVERVLRQHVETVVDRDDARDAPPRMTLALEALFKRVGAEDAQLPDITALPTRTARKQFEAVNERWNARLPKGTAQRVEAFAIPSPAGDAIQALQILPPGGGRASHGTIVHLHGGGWVFGNNRTHLGAMARLAERSGCTVIGIDYGLAPERPFPQGLNDAAWSWRWLRARSPRPKGPWLLAGDSAGANLALALMLDLRHAGEPLPGAALLFYGVYDADHETASHRRFGDGRFGLSSAKMAWYRAHYLAGGARAEDPRVSPLRATSLAGLPPLLVTAAQLDPLHDDSAALAARLAHEGVEHRFISYPGVHHGFMQMAAHLPEADRAFDDAAAFVRHLVRKNA